MILHIVRKDARLLKTLIATVAALQLLQHFIMHRPLPFAADSGTQALEGVTTLALVVAMVLYIVQLVQQDALPGAQQDWLVRPIARRELFLAKLAGVALFVHGPIFVMSMLEGLVSGFPLGALLGANLLSNLSIAIIFTLPVMTVAACTRNLAEAVLGSLIVLIALLLLRYLLLPALGMHFSTEGTGIAWIARVASEPVLLGAMVVALLLMYLKRETAAARAIFIGGLTLFVLIHAIPWRTAYAIQQGLAGASAAQIVVSLEPKAAATGDLPGQLLTAEEDSEPDQQGVLLALPVRMAGLPTNAIAHSDRVTVLLKDERGRTLYRGTGRGFELRGSGAEQVFLQQIELPQHTLDRLKDGHARLELKDDVSVLQPSELASFPSQGNYDPVAGLGRCVTRLTQDGRALEAACRQVRDLPPCLSFRLETRAGAISEERFACSVSYTPNWLRFSPDPMDRVRAKIALREAGAAHGIDSAAAETGVVRVRRYAAHAHLSRQLAISPFNWRDWLAPSRPQGPPP